MREVELAYVYYPSANGMHLREHLQEGHCERYLVHPLRMNGGVYEGHETS